VTTLREIQPAATAPIALEGLDGYELICTEAGRTGDGLTGSVALQNGDLTGDPLRVCWPDPASLDAARKRLAAQLAKKTSVRVKDTDLEQPLRTLYQEVEATLRERRSSSPAPDGKSRPCTEMGNAERLVDRHGAHILYCEIWRDWLIYDGTRWRLRTGSQRARVPQETQHGRCAYLAGHRSAR
jgi:hypothetical protein